MRRLYVAYGETEALAGSLRAWDEGVERARNLGEHAWTHIALATSARGATVAASTAIEGNPLSPEQVANVLAGSPMAAQASAVREVLNYAAALDVARSAARRRRFRWTDELLRRLNATVMAGLPSDERGEFRREPVTVGAYHPPDAVDVPALVEELIDWLAEDRSHPLVRAGLVHLNVVSIHPWLDGNGRTARVAGALSLLRDDVGSPEILNVEAHLRADRDGYFAALLESQGERFDPENHSATPWLEYFAAACVLRLDVQERLFAATPGDFGALTMALVARGEPIEWAPMLLAARLGPIRTTQIATLLGRSAPQVRSMLSRMARGGWLVAEGDRRGRRYRAGRRLMAVDLQVPELLRE